MQKNDNKAKYYKLMEYLKDEILMSRIKPGEQVPSENSLAEEFLLSRHTVRKAISMLVNEGYLYTEHGKGTYCTDWNRKRTNSKNIGVITTYISEYIFPKVVTGIEQVLSDNGYSIFLKNTNNNPLKEALYLEDLLENNIAGLIIEPSKSALFSNNLQYFKALDGHNIPYVFIHGYHQKLEATSYVMLDDAAGMYKAVEYLIKLGHKRIAGIFKGDDMQGLNRHKGYAQALFDGRLLYNPDDVVWFSTEDKDTKPTEVIRQFMEEKRGIDSVVCYNDDIAFRVFELLTGMSIKVPEDISLIGFDDSYLSANSSVKITSVSHPKEKLGEIAAQILLQMLKDSNYLKNPIQNVITPGLVIKESCIQR
jgi:GntR family transcriptional regulator of arabinose operon